MLLKRKMKVHLRLEEIKKIKDMTNNRNAKSPSPKGNPSGTGREGSGLKETRAADLETDKEISNKYTEGTDDIDSNPNARHPNRNTDKGRDDQGEDSTSI